MLPALDIRDLRFSYGQGYAVDGITLQIEEGLFFGLLGPNGAGKSTTIQMLCALLPPQQGSISCFGDSIVAHPMRCKQLMGVVPQEIALYEELSALENLMFWGRMYGLTLKQCRRRAVQLLNLTGLRERARDMIRTYSGGMKRRINLAAALMHEPRILLMDEPTVGVDPQSRIHIFEMLSALHKQGMTIIYTTHYMEEVERLCQRVAIIDHGRIMAEGTLPELKSLCKDESMIIVDIASTDSDNAKLPESLPFSGARMEGETLFVPSVQPQQLLPELVSVLTQQGIGIHRTEIIEPNLEMVFLRLTGRSLRD